jgi:phosphoserine phosphatase
LIDQQAKKDLLIHYARQLNIPLAATMAIGDGANDLMMLQTAGLGIGYRPKPLLQESLDNLILYTDLTAPLYAMGLDDSEIIFS